MADQKELKDAPEIENEEDDLEVEIEDDTPEEDRGREPMPDKIVKDLEDDELEEFSAQKAAQLKKVWHDERRAKEAANREREEAVAVAKRLFEENKALKQNLHNGEKAYVGTAKVAVEREIEAAKREYKEAYEAGESDKVLEAQEKLIAAKLKLQQVENYRPRYQEEAAGQPEKDSVQNASREGWSAEKVEPAAPKPSQNAEAWQKRNKWFGKNRMMTTLAFGVHEALENEGVVIDSPEYYARIDKEMRKRFPEEFQNKPNGQQRSVVASASRTSAPKRVKLTSTQVALAKKFGLTNEQYAKELIKLGDANV